MARPATVAALQVQAKPSVALPIDTTTFPPHMLLARHGCVEVGGAPSGSSP
jgi:hypothetical protein